MTHRQAKNEKDLEQTIAHNRQLRVALARRSFYWFFCIYFLPTLEYPIAAFQREIMAMLEKKELLLILITAFRGSGKSTIVTQAYVLWALLGIQQHKFIVLACLTQNQAQLLFSHVRRSLETNERLRADFGQLEVGSSEWGKDNLVLPVYDARIMAVSTEQSIRGIRHGNHRPSLIIFDDVEDTSSTRTQEGRDKTFGWFAAEAMPAGDEKTRYIIVGGVLHDDSTLMRFQDLISGKRMTGIYRSYPLLKTNGQSIWPERFPDKESIRKLRSMQPSEKFWQQEFLLKIIPSDEQLVLPEHIKYYNKLPSTDEGDFRIIYVGVDPAVSEKETADYTAIVPIQLHDYGPEMQAYVLPPIVKRIRVSELVEEMKLLGTALDNPSFLVENVGAQDYLVQYLKDQTLLDVEGFNPGGRDKRTRLALVTPAMERGQVLFPRRGAKLLITQLLGFGREQHDDLVDAFVIAMLKIIPDSAYSGGPGVSASSDHPDYERFKPLTAGWLKKDW